MEDHELKRQKTIPRIGMWPALYLAGFLMLNGCSAPGGPEEPQARPSPERESSSPGSGLEDDVRIPEIDVDVDIDEKDEDED